MVTFFPSDPNIGRSIGGYNDNLTREAMGRMQEAAAITQAELQAKAQQQAAQQSYFQNQQANAIEQQKLQQLAKYQQGQLENQKSATQAQMDWQKALMGNNAAEAAKDRTSREAIALGKTGPNPLEVQDANNISQSLAGRLNFMLKGLSENKVAEEKKVLDQFTADMDGWSPLTTNSAWKAKRDKALTEVGDRYRTGVQQLLGGLPKDSPIDFDGKQFVPKLLTIPGTTTSTNAPAPAPASVAPGGFFNQAPAVAPAPVAAPAAPPPVATITVKTSDGRIIRGPESAWLKLKAQDPGAQIVEAQPLKPPVGVDMGNGFFRMPMPQ